MQIEKAMINDVYMFQKYPENFALQLFMILQKFTHEICYFLKGTNAVLKIFLYILIHVKILP